MLNIISSTRECSIQQMLQRCDTTGEHEVQQGSMESEDSGQYCELSEVYCGVSHVLLVVMMCKRCHSV